MEEKVKILEENSLYRRFQLKQLKLDKAARGV